MNSSKTKIRFTVAYDGTDYCGWQRQNHGPIKSVQQVLEEALSRLFQEDISVSASGRTDAGVHAREQVCHFETEKSLAALEAWDLPWAMKSILPPAISFRKVFIAPSDFHSTLSATHKTYRYYIYNRPWRSPFLHRYAHWSRKPIDLQHLNASTQYLLGIHDFKSFQSAGTEVAHTTREILKAHWDQPKPHILRFTITGSGFLKQMVRNIVGTQLMLEQRKSPPESIQSILASQDRRQAGPPAPPQGLFLWKVYYPKKLDNKCREL